MQNGPQETQDTLLIKPTDAPATVNVMVRRGEGTESHHVTKGQFMEGNAPDVITRRFDRWENLRADEVRIIPLVKDALLCKTTAGTGEVQVLRETETGETLVRVVFTDGQTQKYWVRMDTSTVVAPVDAAPERDGEAKILLLHYLTGAKNLCELRFEASRRNKRLRRENHPGTETIREESRRSFREGVVRDENGNRVEPDAEGSPLRRAGMI